MAAELDPSRVHNTQGIETIIVHWGKLFSEAWAQASPSARAAAPGLLGGGPALAGQTPDGNKEARNPTNVPTEKIAALFNALSRNLSHTPTDFRVTRTKRSVPIEAFFRQELHGQDAPFDGWINSLIGSEAVDMTFSEESFYQWTGGLTLEQSLAVYECETGKTLTRDLVGILFTDPAQARAILTSDPDIHLHYRAILNGNAPLDIRAAQETDGWLERTTTTPLTHDSVPIGYRRFVAKDGHREVMFKPDGTLDARSAFHGTFNFFSPHAFPLTHIAVDVGPYLTHVKS
jgi:hypothetical protein